MPRGRKKKAVLTEGNEKKNGGYSRGGLVTNGVPNIPNPPPPPKKELSTGNEKKYLGFKMYQGDHKGKLEKMNEMYENGYNYLETQAIGGNEVILYFIKR